jgi:pantoate--beta-alanine ligase
MRMKVIRKIKEMQKYVNRIKGKKIIGFVPTMGYFHEGHIELMRQARKECDVVVVSLFVNPIQFGPKEDYKKYPRDFERDKKLAKYAGVDILFYPDVKEMYHDDFSTYVEVTGKFTNILCGKYRPGHFRGVTTVVSKLFNIVKPDIAYFGQKDIQQCYVIKKMIEDLNFDIKLKIIPTKRENDGLAMSSRNTYLTTQQRKVAPVLYESLMYAKNMIENGEKDSKKIIRKMKELIESKPYTKVQYISIVDAKTFEEVKRITNKVIIALAVFIGDTRLIDNIIV